MSKLRFSLLILIALFLSGCSALHSWGFLDKSNLPPPTPLTNFAPQLTVHPLWATNTGSGTNKRAIKLLLAYSDGMLFTADARGYVVAVNSANGRRLWSQRINGPVISGPAVNDGLVVVTTDTHVVALNQQNGSMAWIAAIPNESLAAPAIGSGLVIVKTIDGNVVSFDAKSGDPRWQYHHGSPLLILRGSSVPQIDGNHVIIGFADGVVDTLNAQSGNIYWERQIAIPEGTAQVEQLVDIDADPKVAGGVVYVATYQGNIFALDVDSGRPLWSHKISSYSGLTVGDSQVFVADEDSHLWAFSRNSGNITWQQEGLAARYLTGPNTMDNFNAVVVGDSLGYVHWLSQSDGHFIARTFVDRSGMIAPPVVVGDTVYVVARNGRVAALQVAH